MAGSLNKVLLIGRLGADPEIKQMVNGKSVARLSLATSNTWKDKNTGEKKEKTEWHRIVIFNEGLVNVVQQYVKKGAQVYIEGQLTTRKWKDEKSGSDKYSTEAALKQLWMGRSYNYMMRVREKKKWWASNLGPHGFPEWYFGQFNAQLPCYYDYEWSNECAPQYENNYCRET